jgi:hypothetical protein
MIMAQDRQIFLRVFSVGRLFRENNQFWRILPTVIEELVGLVENWVAKGLELGKPLNQKRPLEAR